MGADQKGDAVKRTTKTGSLLTRGRIRKGQSQEQIAEALGCVRGHVANVEGGRSSIPGERLLDWAEAYGVGLRALAEALREDFRG